MKTTAEPKKNISFIVFFAVLLDALFFALNPLQLTEIFFWSSEFKDVTDQIFIAFSGTEMGG